MKDEQPPMMPAVRLNALLQLIPDDARTVADIGFDHGRLIKRLVISRPQVRVIGVELAERFAREFWRINRFRDAGVRDRIDLRTGSGLQPLNAGEADCLVLAGMGESKIIEILTRDPQKLPGVAGMVLAPTRYFIKLRRVLQSLGYFTAREMLVLERGRYYHLALAIPGKDPAVNTLPWHFAPRLFEMRHPHLYDYLALMKRFLAVRLPHLASQQPDIRAYLGIMDDAIALARTFASSPDNG